MGCVSSKNKNKITILIINKLPKNTKLSSEIVLEKDADLNSLFCDVNIFGYFPTTIRLYPEDKSPPTPDFSNLNSIDSRIELFLSFKEMIQLVACWCIRRKIIESGISCSEQENFHENFNEIYVAPCTEHPLFKDRIGRPHTDPPFDLPCECLEFNKGRCSNCKIRFLL